MSHAKTLGLLFASLMALIQAALASPAGAQVAGAQPAAPPEIAFVSEPNFLKLPPDLYLGEVAGVAVSPAGRIAVFSRGNATGPAYGAAAAQLLEFDRDGRYIREIGHNLYAWSFAHAIRFDPQGNLWAADKGSDMVIRFDPEGRVTWVFGRKPEASDESAHPLGHPKPPLPPAPGMFRQVTDMAWDSAGNTYISDGYINSRVARIGPDGQWLGDFGEPGSGPGQFNTLHSIAVDRQDRIYVADRGNGRIQVFDTAGKLLKIITINVPAPADAPAAIGFRPEPGEAGGYGGASRTMQPGAPWALCITPGPTQYLYVSDAYPGRIYKLNLEGKVLGWLGGSGRQLKQFGWIHELACPAENELYVAELLNWWVQKLTLHPR